MPRTMLATGAGAIVHHRSGRKPAKNASVMINAAIRQYIGGSSGAVSPVPRAGSGPRGDLHDVEPLAVALDPAVQRVLEHLLDRRRDLAAGAVADVDVVDRAHRGQLGRGAGEEDLVGQRQLGA